MSSDEKVILDGSKTSTAAGHFDRRSFLRVLGAAFSTALLPEMLTSCAEDGAEQVAVHGTEALTISRSVTVIRPEDLLVLTIGFVNLKRSTAGQLVKSVNTSAAQIVLDFPPQAFAEDAVAYTGSVPSVFANAMLGGPTRLIFQVPDAYTPVPYSLSSILAVCGSSSLVVSAPMQNTIAIATAHLPASPDGGTTPASGDSLVDSTLATALALVDPAASGRAMAFAKQLPAGLETYQGVTGEPPGISTNAVSLIEIPFRLKLSPNCLAGWSHATKPVQGTSGAFEVWHTTLGVRSVAPNVAGTVDERNAYLRTARALWTRDLDLGLCGSVSVPATATYCTDQDPQPPPQPSPFEGTSPIVNASLKPSQRTRIVQNSSQSAGAPPIQIDRLMLSSLGGYLDARGDWNDSYVERWIHKMSGGRESFVEVDTPGFLLPFGNTATSLQITRRNDNPNIGPVGALYAFNLILVGNPATSYRSADVQPTTAASLFQWPFLAIELQKTRFVTQPFGPGVTTWPLDPSGAHIMVPVIGYDRRGRAIKFSVPLVFATAGVSANDARAEYRSLLGAAGSAPPCPASQQPTPGAPSLNVSMGGQRIAYADSSNAGSTNGSGPKRAAKDDTSFATQTLSFDLQVVSDAFKYAPVLTNAIIDVESLHSYVPNGPSGTPSPVSIWYHPTFLLAPGFNPPGNTNRSQLLFQLQSSVTADFTKDSSGATRSDCGTGFVAPNMTFTALSRTTGPAYDGSVTPTVPPGATPQAPSPGSFVDGAFDPSVYLGMAESALANIQIFGVFSILDIIKAVLPGEADADLAGLAASAEEGALKYAPKFISQGLSELERIISLIAEVKSQIELVYTNAQELVGNTNPGSNGLAGTLASASSFTLNGALQAGGETAMQVVRPLVTPVINAAMAFYADIQATVTAIENVEVASLVSTTPPPAAGSILQLINDGTALENAIAALANLGARATFSAQPIALNGNPATGAAAAAVNAAANAALAAGAGPMNQVTNAALQIAAGIQQTFGNKLQDLLTALGVVGPVANGTFGNVDEVLSKISTLFTDAQQALDAVRDMTVKIDWQPKVGAFAIPGTGWPIFRPASQHALTLALEIRAKATDTQSAGVDLSCRLDHFDFCIGQTSDGDNGSTGIVGIQVDHIAFSMEAGKKPDVDVKINGLSFGGPLSFLEALQKLIPPDGFSDPPFLNVTTSGIQAGFTLAIPSAAVGMFSLENIAIKAELDIPFFTSGGVGSALTFTFSFCDSDHPFIITVSALGGGGYLVVSFTPTGLQHLEASICVAAQLAINLADVVQGSITIMLGITFTLDESTSGVQDVSLTGFLRIHGEVDVLGLITISVDVTGSVTCDIKNRIIIGQVVITVDVTLVFFSINQSVPFRKEFHACNNDPTLRQLMPPGPNNAASLYWTDYCHAYA